MSSSGKGGYVELQRKAFQKTIDGKPVDLYTIANRRGMVVRLTNYGCRIVQIIVPDRNGIMGDVALGHDSIEGVLSGFPSMGAFIGRVCNRVSNARVVIDGKECKLGANDGAHSLHGGQKGSRFQVFDARQLSDNSLQMSYTFDDGEEGYPGTVPLRVIYTVTDDNALEIAYDAVSVDKTTLVGFTDHTFFNLSGDFSTAITDHVLTVNADHMLATDEGKAVTGKLRDVADTPMDFRQPKAIGRDINADFDMLKIGNGYDLNYLIREQRDGEVVRHAEIFDPKTGRSMEVWSNEPCLVVFSGNGLAAQAPRDIGKGGVLHHFRSGFCLESQQYPNGPNCPDFPSTTLKPNDWFSGKIIYKFGVIG